MVIGVTRCQLERAKVQYRPARENVCHKKLRLNLLGAINIGPKKLGSYYSAYTSFVCLNFLWHTPHAVALDNVLSLSPK